MEMNFTEAFFENENQVWCISRNDNYLYRLDIEKAIVEEIILLSPEEYQNGGYDDILCYDKFFILVPRSAESDIIIVNRENWTKQYIKIPQQNVRVGVDKVDFHKGIIYKDNLFLFGCAYPGIVKVNIQSKIVEVIDDWLVSAQKLFNNMQDGCFHKQYIQLHDMVYFPFMNANAMLCFNLATEASHVYTVGNQKQRYISVEWDGINFWLVPRDGSVGSIVKWNPESNVTKYFDDYPKEFDYQSKAFYRSELVDNKLYIFAHLGNLNICLDTKEEKMEAFPHLLEEVRGCRYPFVWRKDEQIWILDKEQLVKWNLHRDEISFIPYVIEKKIVRRYEKWKNRNYFEKTMEQKKLVRETKKYGLQEYIRYISIR